MRCSEREGGAGSPLPSATERTSGTSRAWAKCRTAASWVAAPGAGLCQLRGQHVQGPQVPDL